MLDVPSAIQSRNYQPRCRIKTYCQTCDCKPSGFSSAACQTRVSVLNQTPVLPCRKCHESNFKLNSIYRQFNIKNRTSIHESTANAFLPTGPRQTHPLAWFKYYIKKIKIKFCTRRGSCHLNPIKYSCTPSNSVTPKHPKLVHLWIRQKPDTGDITTTHQKINPIFCVHRTCPLVRRTSCITWYRSSTSMPWYVYVLLCHQIRNEPKCTPSHRVSKPDAIRPTILNLVAHIIQTMFQMCDAYSLIPKRSERWSVFFHVQHELNMFLSPGRSHSTISYLQCPQCSIELIRSCFNALEPNRRTEKKIPFLFVVYTKWCDMCLFCYPTWCFSQTLSST
jgi:hypothetical protein